MSQAIQNGFEASTLERWRARPMSAKARSLSEFNSVREVARLSQLAMRWVCLVTVLMAPSKAKFHNKPAQVSPNVTADTKWRFCPWNLRPKLLRPWAVGSYAEARRLAANIAKLPTGRPVVLGETMILVGGDN